MDRRARVGLRCLDEQMVDRHRIRARRERDRVSEHDGRRPIGRRDRHRARAHQRPAGRGWRIRRSTARADRVLSDVGGARRRDRPDRNVRELPRQRRQRGDGTVIEQVDRERVDRDRRVAGQVEEQVRPERRVDGAEIGRAVERRSQGLRARRRYALSMKAGRSQCGDDSTREQVLEHGFFERGSGQDRPWESTGHSRA